MRAEERILLLLGILTILVSASAASVSIEPRESSSTPVEPAYFQIFLSPGEDTNYTVSADGPGNAIVAPKSIQVEAGENSSVNLWFRPFRDIRPGKYTLEVEVDSGEETVSFSRLLEIDNEHIVEIVEHSEPTCGNGFRINATVKNSGFSTEDLDVLTGGEKVSSFVLEPGERKRFNLTLEEPVFRVLSSGTYASDIQEVELPSCGEEDGVILGSFFSSQSSMAASLVLLVAAVFAALKYSGRLELGDYM